MSVLVVHAQSSECPQCSPADRLVASILHAPNAIDLSFNEHHGRVLGDSVAIAIAKQLRLSDLLDPEKAVRVLLLVSYAFSQSAAIETDEDRRPGVSLVLLDYLAEKAPDLLIRQKAEALAIKVRASTTPPIPAEPFPRH